MMRTVLSLMVLFLFSQVTVADDRSEYFSGADDGIIRSFTLEPNKQVGESTLKASPDVHGALLITAGNGSFLGNIKSEDFPVAIVGLKGLSTPNSDALAKAARSLIPGETADVWFLKLGVTGADYFIRKGSLEKATFRVPVRRESIPKRLEKIVDEVEGTVWYRTQGKTIPPNSEGTTLHVYFQWDDKRLGAMNLRLKAEILTERLLIPNEIGIRSGDKFRSADVSPRDCDFSGSRVRVDMPLRGELLQGISIATSRFEGVVRFKNSRGAVLDHEFSAYEFDQLGNALLGYICLNGDISMLPELKRHMHLLFDSDRNYASSLRSEPLKPFSEQDFREADQKREAENKATEMAKNKMSEEAAKSELSSRNERTAKSKLAFAKQQRSSGKKDLAEKYLKEILDKFPETEAAKEAKELLGR